MKMSLLFRHSIGIICCTRSLCNAVQVAKVPKLKSRKVLHLSSMIKNDLLINKKLLRLGNIKDDEWGPIREDLLKNYPTLSETTIDSQVYDICFYYNRLDQAMIYFKFLESNNYKLNLNVKITYLKIFYTRNQPITAEEEADILNIYDDIQKQYPLLDLKSCTNCILAISLTNRWRECFQLLDMLKFTSTPGSSVITAIISACFKNNEPSIAWKMMNEYIDQRPIGHNAYQEYLNYCKRNFTINELQGEVDKMFLFWKKNHITPTEFVVKDYIKFYETFGYISQYTSINKNGVCSSCRHTLEQITLSKMDFKVLSESIMRHLIVGKNVYCSTSPQELKRYMIFVQTMKPYHVVIDGLNVAYAARKSGQPGDLRGVLNIVNYFYNQKKRVLVIGRVHMNWWSNEVMKQIKERADVFLAKNLSQDDPFLLYITLKSGPQTYFVSRDLMRHQKSILKDPNIQRLFKNWQLSRQYFYEKATLGSKIKLIPPLPYEATSQNDDCGWHIPFTKSEYLLTPQIYDAPENWFCLRKKMKL